MAKALIVSGGWDGHKPFEVAEVLTGSLEGQGVQVENSRDLDDLKRSAEFDLVVPNWTMGSIDPGQVQPLVEAVAGGIGLAGIHGGMGDAFRSSTEYQFVVGGQFVAHPGPGDRRYSVRFRPGHALTQGLEDFEVATEKYYLHVDPAMRVLATTEFEDFDGTVMPVAWTKAWGEGRVFYCSLGHDPEIVSHPLTLEFVTRGMLWAADRASTLQGDRFGEVYGRA
ncbi:MAG: ThuA domain-containing protein [Armatimonadetes bacterium]|nr:ThuA domain-containing protein [Armatimonadota bacterium]MBS1710442.1 ThuA domain-containing protein [Armatimonadota bacterium]MBX3108113.1 ThuA domain-containing protein [Fimbriimonadaceae bacterium]